jgi:hypothetical protein
MSDSARNLLGPYPAGVPSPRVVHVHPYPTRFHGSINTRPWFNFPYREQPHAVFKPDDYNQENPMMSGLGALQYNTGRGIFLPQGHGGGIFDENISGVGSAALGYSVQNLPWHKYDDDTLALQKDLNKALRDLDKPTVKEDGKLGDNTCGAARLVSKSSGYGYIEVPPECSKTHGSPAPSPAPTISTTEASTLPPRRGMSSGTKNALVFGGAAVLALGGAYLIMKGMKKRKG